MNADILAELIDGWDVGSAAVGVSDSRHTLVVVGDPSWTTPIASVSKLLVTMAVLVAIEEGTLSLDEAAGPPGATLRHLLAHASGLGFEHGDPGGIPGERRVYSNTGIELAAELLARRSELAFTDYLRSGVLEPLSMARTSLHGSPAHQMHSCVDDLLRLGRELLAPTLVHRSTLATATSVQFPGLGGVLPGVGSFQPNDWGLGFELRDTKRPHWTGSRNSPATFGHFGGSGTFLWVDPEAGLACVALTDRGFGGWAMRAWPELSDEVLLSAPRARATPPTG